MQTLKCPILLHKSSPSPTCWSWGHLLRLKKIKWKHCHHWSLQVIFWHQIASLIFLGSLRVHDGKPNEIQKRNSSQHDPRNWRTQNLQSTIRHLQSQQSSHQNLQTLLLVRISTTTNKWKKQNLQNLHSSIDCPKQWECGAYASFSASTFLKPPFWKMFFIPRASLGECFCTGTIAHRNGGAHMRVGETQRMCVLVTSSVVIMWSDVKCWLVI